MPLEKVEDWRRSGFAGRFAAGLTDPTCPTPSGVIGPRGKSAVKRYTVYRNNVTVSLIDALAAIYLMAFLSASGEVGFPVLLVLGFGTRFAATGLLFMTLIVELTVPDGWPVHITWAAMALAIMAWGSGRFSVDQLIESLRPARTAD